MLEWIPVDSLQVANSSPCHAAVLGQRTRTKGLKTLLSMSECPAGLCDDGQPIPAQFKYMGAGCVSIPGPIF